MFILIFDKVMVQQLRRLARDAVLRSRLHKMFDSIERLGPRAGQLLDSQGLYEVKSLRPPIRLYFRCREGSNEILVFEYGLKTSVAAQQRVIDRLRLRIRDRRE